MKRLKITILLALLIVAACKQPSPEEQIQAKAKEVITAYFNANWPKELKIDSLVFVEMDTITEKFLGYNAYNHLEARFLQKNEYVKLKKRDYDLKKYLFGNTANDLMKMLREDLAKETDSLDMIIASWNKIDSINRANVLDSTNLVYYYFSYKLRYVLPDMSVEEEVFPVVFTPDLKIDKYYLKKFFEKMELVPY